MEFSPTSAVPGEETTLKVKALPDSLCGVSAVDQSVLVKEPGKTLTPEQVEAHSGHPQGHLRVKRNKVKMLRPVSMSSFNFCCHFQMFELLPAGKPAGMPYEEDEVSCLHVRQKRYIGRRPPSDVNDVNSIFEVNSVLFFQPWVVYTWKSKLMTCC